MTIVNSCNDDDSGMEELTVTMSYVETQCDDPWNIDGIGAGRFENLRSYLDQIGIDVVSMRSITDQGPVCGACFCPSGLTFLVEVSDIYIDELTNLGFEPM